MKPDIKLKLINRLLTGNDKQIRNALHTEQGFCVLGLLCDIYLQETHQEWDWKYQPMIGAAVNGSVSGVSRTIMTWAGLNDDQVVRLMNANDNGGVSFPGMIDLLMKNPVFDKIP